MFHRRFGKAIKVPDGPHPAVLTEFTREVMENVTSLTFPCAAPYVSLCGPGACWVIAAIGGENDVQEELCL